MRTQIRLNEREIKNIPAPLSGNKVFYDTEIRGFGIRVTAGGTRSFVLNYRIRARERRYTIGRWPEWSVVAARKEAADLRREIDLGHDPLEARHEEYEAPTIKTLFERYDREHLPRKTMRSASDNRSMWRNYILTEIGAKKVTDVTREDVSRIHRKISQDKPVRANRVIEVIRSALNLAIDWGWLEKNPAARVAKNAELPRNRYLSKKELSLVFEIMQRHPQNMSVDAIRLMLLTGCRKSEALSAKWDQFDLDEAIWVKPSSHTKQKRDHRVPLSDDAVDLLKGLQSFGVSQFLFPSGKEGHLKDCKRTWYSLREKATSALWRDKSDVNELILYLEKEFKRQPTISEIQNRATGLGMTLPTGLLDVRIHDLRHSYASILASEGLSLPIIGALLGHTQPQTTARYAHLLDEPLRAATNAVSIAMRPKQTGFNDEQK